MSSKKILLSLLTISIVSFLSKIIGFIREGFIASAFGTTSETDIFFLAYGVYSAIMFMIGMSIGIAYLPLFIDEEQHYGIISAKRTCSKLVNQIFVFSGTLSFFIYIYSDQLSKIIAPNYSADKLIVLSNYIEILSVVVFFSIIIYVLGAVLDSQSKYGLKELLGMSYSIMSIIMILLFRKKLGVEVLLYSFILSSIIQFIILMAVTFKNKACYIFHFAFNDPNIRKVYLISFSVLWGSGFLFVGQAIDRIIASTLSVGSVSALNYAGILHSFINSLLIISFVTVFFTEMSKKVNEENMSGFTDTWRKGSLTLIIILLPMSVLFFFNSSDIVSCTLQRGAFNSESVKLTSSVLSFYVLGTPFYGIRDLTTRAFYATSNRKIPMLNGFFTILLNISLSLIFSFLWGVKGIALSASVSAFISCAFLVWNLSRRYSLKLKLLMKKIGKILLALSISVLILLALNSYLEYVNSFIRLLLALFTVFVSYFGILIVLRCDEMNYLLNVLKRRFFQKTEL